MLVRPSIPHVKAKNATAPRPIRAVLTALTVSLVAASAAAAHPSTTICDTVAPSQSALQKALGVAIHGPVSVAGTPMHCDVSGYRDGARIYLYPGSMAKTVAGELTQAFGTHAPTRQALSGLGSGATLEFAQGAAFVYFTSGSRFVLISGSTATNTQLVAVSRAVHAKLG
jgi:hypothetical protein